MVIKVFFYKLKTVNFIFNVKNLNNEQQSQYPLADIYEKTGEHLLGFVDIHKYFEFADLKSTSCFYLEKHFSKFYDDQLTFSMNSLKVW